VIDDLRPAGASDDVVFAGESVAGNFQVKLAHSRYQRLAGIGILANVEGGIFVGNLLQRRQHLFGINAGGGLDGLRDHRLIGIDLL